MSGTHRWRAPRQDEAVLAEPSPQQLGTILSDNRRRLAETAVSLLGRPLAEVRRQGRREALTAATQYLTNAGEPLPPVVGDSLLLAGHQPELFHPGVWVKNFALNGLARQHGCTPLNLVVDNDTEKSSSIRVPTRNDHVHQAAVAYDHWSREIPYEELPVREEGIFARFADQAGALLQGWGFTPLLPDLWAEVMRQAKRTPLLGERFVAARRTFERRWGCHNYEVPLSALCGTETFAVFACHILSDLPRFHATYNETVHEHRRQHGIRSRNHPVPDLARDGDWYEAPFWVWRTGQARRGRLFVQPTSDGLRLRSGDEIGPGVRRGSAGVKDWLALEGAGFKVRTRALTTTLFSRLLLADLFIHGIGGGKYDELTDELMTRFFGCQPPEFMVISATLLLPLPMAPARPDDRRRLSHQLRDLHYNPQRHLTDGQRADADVQSLLQQKQAIVAAEPADRSGRRERYRRIREVSERLRGHVTEREKALRGQLARLDEELRTNAILERRDYSFCLFPEEKLRSFCQRFLKPQVL